MSPGPLLSIYGYLRVYLRRVQIAGVGAGAATHIRERDVRDHTAKQIVRNNGRSIPAHLPVTCYLLPVTCCCHCLFGSHSCCCSCSCGAFAAKVLPPNTVEGPSVGICVMRKGSESQLREADKKYVYFV